MALPFSPAGGTAANNSPVGSAGQPFPFGKGKGTSPKDKEKSGKMNAIERRMKRVNDKNKGKK